jgi:hypothetical protein
MLQISNDGATNEKTREPTTKTAKLEIAYPLQLDQTAKTREVDAQNI